MKVKAQNTHHVDVTTASARVRFTRSQVTESAASSATMLAA